MVARPKIYYPPSYIITNLRTIGNEYMYLNGVEYTGYYHKYLDGMVMTGAIYDINTSEYLIPYKNLKSNFVYDSLVDINLENYRAPMYKFPKPSPSDYEYGSFKRYFLRRVNDVNSSIIEVDYNQFNSWNSSSTIDKNLYIGLEINWKLTGQIHDYKENEILIPGVLSTNNRTIITESANYKGLDKILKNPIEFYKNL